MGHIVYAAQSGTLGSYYAGCATMEAVSIRAFLELAAQLTRWNAPAALVTGCRSAAMDELRHTRIFIELARKEGYAPFPAAQKKTRQDIYSVALHNAVEGCVNETWAALIAHYQALHADSATLRIVYAQIADDETRHGQLAWDLHDWFMTQLAQDEREAIRRAQAAAITRLADCTPEPAWQPTGVGLPTVEMTAQLAAGFKRALAAA